MGVHIRCPCRSGRRECDAPSDRCTDKAELGVARSMHWLDAASIWRSNLSLDLRRPLRYAKRNHSTFGCCETKRIGSRQKYRGKWFGSCDTNGAASRRVGSGCCTKLYGVGEPGEGRENVAKAQRHIWEAALPSGTTLHQSINPASRSRLLARTIDTRV